MFSRRKRSIEDLREEIRSHIDLASDELRENGADSDEASRTAHLKFGNVTGVLEASWERSRCLWWDNFTRDLRYGLRRLRKSPGFAATAILTLAIGIGSNTAVFSVVNSVLLKPLAYPNPGELVAVRQIAPGAAGLGNISSDLPLSGSMYFTYAEQNHTLQSLGIWTSGRENVTGLAEPEQVRSILISDGVLQALAVAPLLGRWLSRADQMPGGSDTVMLSYGYWQRRFGGDHSVIGRRIMVDSRPREIVGVMPRGFRFADRDIDLILPVALDRGKLILAGFDFQGIARLKPGITIAQADADLKRLVTVWMNSWSNGPRITNPRVYESWRITPALRPLKQDVVGSVSNVLWVVMGTIGIVMLIVCANITNLLLVRAESRQQELAIRAALGAGRGRIVRGLLLESVLLGVMGGAVGLPIGWAALRFLVAIAPGNLPRMNEISLDSWTLVFTLVLSILCGLLLGLIPALKYARLRISADLRSAGRGSSTTRERYRSRNVLVVVQVAVALMLLVSAGLIIRTFEALRTVDPGFTHGEQLQLMQIYIPPSLVREPERVTRMQNEIADKLSAIPGVMSVGFAEAMPLEENASNWDEIIFEGKQYDPGKIPPLYLYEKVSPGFFRTVGTRIVAGRGFTWTDVYGRRPVGMISENLAREAWGSPAAALGKRFVEIPGTPWREVIGVIQDVHENGIQEKAPEIVYWPTLTDGAYGGAVRAVTFAIRSRSAGTAGFLSRIQQAVWSVNSNLPLASVRTMQDIYDRSLARISFTLVMLGIAAAMALLIGIIGIYGVISYLVARRTNEIGLRFALGAAPVHVFRLIVGSSMHPVGLGLLTGLAGTVVVSRALQALLFGVSSQDPLTIGCVVVALILAALVASSVPAYRATRIEPMAALRQE